MGIYDRDYVRADGGEENRWGAGGKSKRKGAGGGGGGGGLNRFNPRGWSMTGWLVAINIAVAVLGMVLFMLPQHGGWQAVPVAVEWIPDVAEQVKETALEVGVSKVEKVTNGAPIVTPTRVRIGTQFYRAMTIDQAWGHFSTFKAFGQFEIWRFVTFQFLHFGWMHLAFNLIGLWTFGPDVEEYLGRKRYLALYLVCGVFGAVAYLLLNGLGNLFPDVRIPGLLIHDTRTPLVGASAGIFGIMLAAAFVVPQRVIDLLYIIPLRIKPAVYLFFGIALLSLLFGSRNAGGEAAHVGGALAGYYFIRHMYHLRDFFDFFGPAPKKEGKGEKAKLGKGSAAEGGKGGKVDQDEVDRILAKLHMHGDAALDEYERETLRQATAAAKGETTPSPERGA
ncbi:MAG: rhomboid family intramembrane serine protease [Phycisphaerales bacterium]|nr:rhomboid family intramembrane serine protease [Phycisphaerales bacterium]